MEILPNDISPNDLARASVETWITSGRTIDPPLEPLGILAERAGAFVTIRLIDGTLRGCIGTVGPTLPTVAEEIISSAIKAASSDPRFPPVSKKELLLLSYGVDVLNLPEPISSPDQLDPARYGLIIEDMSNKRRGLLLPGIPGIDRPDEQWLAVHQKAGIKLGAQVKAQRFTVERFGKD